jgi:ribosomal protein L11 methyltransferase
MDYIEVSIFGKPEFDYEIIIAQLGEMGFESFSESDTGIAGYIQEVLYHESEVRKYLDELSISSDTRYSISKIVQQNWNKLWESAYEPVTVSGKVRVRAPFHDPDPAFPFEIVIEPKMSFGTAHHATTSLMLEMLLMEELEGCRVLDMGCGTGVLAILAALMKAGTVVAVDTDEWAYENAVENMQRNHIASVVVIQGDAAVIPKPDYDLIIANINRNVLLADLPVYTANLNQPGVLLMSGFYEEDLPLIHEVAVNNGLQLVGYRTENNWVGVKYIK